VSAGLSRRAVVPIPADAEMKLEDLRAIVAERPRAELKIRAAYLLAIIDEGTGLIGHVARLESELARTRQVVDGSTGP